MERFDLRQQDCLKFRCRLLDTADGKDSHRLFSGVYFPRFRNMYLDEIITTTVGGLRGQPQLRLVEHFPLDVHYKTGVDPSNGLRSTLRVQDAADTSAELLEKHFFGVADFVPGAKVAFGASISARDRKPRLFTVTEIDDRLLRTRDQPDIPVSPPEEQFQTLRLRSLPDSVKNLLLQIRDAFIERSGGNVTGAIKLIGRRFRIMDDNGDRKISRSELDKAVADVGLRFSRTEMDQVFDAMNSNDASDNAIDYEEFMDVIRGPMNMQRKLVVLEAFDKLDMDRDGVITLEELRIKYNVGPSNPLVQRGATPDEVLQQFAAQWDTHDKNGKITLAEFQDYYNGVSSSIDNDDHFELLVRNAWKLPLRK